MPIDNGAWRQPRTHEVYRTGLVVAQRLSPPAVRVQFPDRDNITTYWLPMVGTNTQNNKDFWIPDIGEQVVVLMDSNDEDGCVVGSVWSTVDNIASMSTNKRHISFSDGTVLEYDRSTHVLIVQLGAGGSATVSTPTGSHFNLDAPGNANVVAGSGANVTASTPAGNSINLDPAGNVNITAGTAGVVNITNQGSSVVDALMSAAKFLAVFNAHTHTGVQSGGGNSGPPTTPLNAGNVSSTITKTDG